MRRERNSAIELIRIISMYLIILGHFEWQTRWSFDSSNIILKSSVESLWIGGKLGVDLFVLISGYFLIKSRFKIKSFLNIWLISYVYSIVIFLFAIFSGMRQFNLKLLLKAIFPSTSGYVNWFVTAYLIMYLLSPFVNMLLKQLNKRQFQILLFILILNFSVLRTIFHNPSVGTSGNDAVWLLIVYTCGAYIRIYKKDIMNKFQSKYIYLTLIVSLVFSVGSVFAINYGEMLFNIKNKSMLYGLFLDGFSPSQLLSAVCLFLIFLKIKPFNNKAINKIASTTFAIYLIHANTIIVDPLWNGMVKGYRYEGSAKVILYGIFVSCLIFLVCSLIELVRKVVFGKIHNKIIEFLAGLKIWRFFQIDE